MKFFSTAILAPAFLMALTVLGGIRDASATISVSPSFGNLGAFTLNQTNGSVNDAPEIVGGILDLTSQQYGENSSLIYNTKQTISNFSASFVYQYTGTLSGSLGPGNGFTFIVENDTRGTTAVGGSGFADGQAGQGGTIAPSVAVEFNLFTGFGQAIGTQVAINGDYGPFQAGSNSYFVVPGNINLISGDPIQVSLTYNGVTLTESLKDLTTGSTWSTSYTENIASIVGATTAYVGITGGTGGAVGSQTISNFVFNSNTQPAPPAPVVPKISFTASGTQETNTVVGGPTTYYALVVANISASATADNFQITNATFTSTSGGTIVDPTVTALPTTPNQIQLGTPSAYYLQFNYNAAATVPTTGTLAISAKYQYWNGTAWIPATYSGSLRGVTIAP